MNTIENNELIDWKNEIIWKNPEEAFDTLSKRIENWVENTWNILKVWEKVAQLNEEDTSKLKNIFDNYLKIETV